MCQLYAEKVRFGATVTKILEKDNSEEEKFIWGS